MADITMCLDAECPQKKTCYRANAAVNENMQTYFSEKVRTNEGCRHYWHNTLTYKRSKRK